MHPPRAPHAAICREFPLGRRRAADGVRARAGESGVVLLFWRRRPCCADGAGGYGEVRCAGGDGKRGQDERAAEGGVGGCGVGGDGEGVEEAEGVSWVEGEDEKVGAMHFMADRESEEPVSMVRDGPGRTFR